MPGTMAGFSSCTCLRLTRKQFIVILLTSVVVMNEWLSYAITAVRWPVLDTHSEDSVRVLFAADPQILSLLSDSEPKFPLSLLTIWDGNRFVSRGFQMALWKTKPDIVVFLGDLLNDGSIANDSDFNSTLLHFKTIMNVPNYVKHTIFIPGDNDIGGEGLDIVTFHKVERFYAFLNQSRTLQYKFVDFIQVRAMDDYDYPEDFLPQVEGRIRILLSHFPLLTKTRKKIKERIIREIPSFIFSGHDHESFHFFGPKEEAHAHRFEILQEPNIWDFEAHGPELHEVAVPTCSYRMGKNIYGYGTAVIEKSGRVSYAVLWLPSRFTQLWIYLGTILVTGSTILPGFLWINRCFIFRLLQICTKMTMMLTVQRSHRM